MELSFSQVSSIYLDSFRSIYLESWGPRREDIYNSMKSTEIGQGFALPGTETLVEASQL